MMAQYIMNAIIVTILIAVVVLFVLLLLLPARALRLGGFLPQLTNEDHPIVRDHTIVHITGSSGSGKSTLGEKLSRLHPTLAVKDTDEFIQHHTAGGMKLTAMRESPEYDTFEYEKAWRKIWDDEMSQFITRNFGKTIVFVGLTNNFGPRERNVLYDIARAADKFPEYSMERFYIDIPMRDLLKQYYLRICKDSAIWDRVIAGTQEIDSASAIQHAEHDLRKIHLSMNPPYKLATSRNILKYFAA